MTGAGAIATFYALYFAVIGVLTPFLSTYLTNTLHFTGSQVGLVLAVQPLCGLVWPRLWARLADAWGRPERVLRIVAVGAAGSFIALLFMRQLSSVLMSIFVYASFVTAIVPLTDALTLSWVKSHGGSYGRIRLMGSLGYVLSSAFAGVLLSRASFPVLGLALIPIVLYAGASFFLPVSAAPLTSVDSAENPFNLRLALFLTATCLHWTSMGPQQSVLALHTQSLGHPSWVPGLSHSLGSLAEVAVLFTYPRWAHRIAPTRLLMVAFGATIARWVLMAVVRSSVGIIVVSLLHALTFGAFLVAAYACLVEWIPDRSRARGQAVFSAATYSLGGLLGNLLAGWGFDAFGGRALFFLAAAIEALPLMFLLMVRR